MLFYHVPRRSSRALVCLTAIFALTVFSSNAISQVREMPADAMGFPGFERNYPAARQLGQERLGSAADGDLDPTFAPTLEYSNGFAYAAEELPNGKFLVAGSFKSIGGHVSPSIVRLNADRSIDTGFTPATIRGTIFRIAVQPDGKILIVGAFNAYNATTSRYAVARLNVDGSLDTTFNVGSGPENLVRDIALQADGKIVIGGDFIAVDGESRLGVARLNSDGSLDAGFAPPLVPATSFPTGGVSGVGIQPDGKIILGGAMSITFGQVKWVLRLNTDGSFDGTFTSPTMNSNPWDIAVQPDGKIVMVGFFTTVNSISRPRIARLNADGSLDAGFTPGTGANTSTTTVRVLPSGSVLVTGTFSSINGTPRGGIAQLNPDGSLDGSFAPSGSSVGSIHGAIQTSAGDYLVPGSFTRISGSDQNTLALLNANGSVNTGFVANSLNYPSVRTAITRADGKMIVGGFFNRLNGSAVNSIVRFNADGSHDTTFSSGVSIAGFVTEIVEQPDGKLLVLGTQLRINNGPPQAAVRLNENGTHDTSFTLATIPQILTGYAAAVQPNGQIVFSYGTTSADPTMNSSIVRLNSDGSLDPLFSSRNIQVESIAILPNGQIMAAGPFAFAYVDSQVPTYEPHNAVIRMNADGAHDRTFQSAFTVDGNSVPAAYAMRVQPDGKILIGGRLFTGGSTTPTGIARLNATGTLDGTFQSSTISSVFGQPTVFAIQPTADGKLLIGGYFENYAGGGDTNLARLNANGTVDDSFAATTDNTVNTIAMQPNGSVVIGGTFEKVNNVGRTALARLVSESTPGDAAPFDFDGDGKTDLGIFRPGVGEWWINRSSNGSTFAAQFGASTDKIVPADFTGDGKTDVAFWRPATGEWFVLRSEDGSFFSFPFGASEDIPVPADYDADGKADPAVFRPSTATWYIQRSSDNGTTIAQFGATGDHPVAADYDGDGRADLAIYRPSNGQWWLNRSTAGVIAMAFGNATDKTVPGDYTGDGKADVAFWRESTGEWFIQRSEDSSYYSVPFGTSGDIAAPGDFDGDGKIDTTVFRPSSATWFSQRSTAGTLIQQFGANGDQPLPNAFVR